MTLSRPFSTWPASRRWKPPAEVTIVRSYQPCVAAVGQFDKTGVRSRRALIAELFFTRYWPRFGEPLP